MPTFEITAPDGRVFDVEGPDAKGALAALTKALGQATPKTEQPKQEMVGFGERSQREQDMPLDQEAQDELAIAKQMAVERQMPFNSQTGATGAFLGGARQGLSDEVSGAVGAIGSTLKGEGPARGYHIGKEVSKRLAQEFADKNPSTAKGLNFAGSVLSAPPLRQSPWGAGATLGATMKDGLRAGGTLGAIQGFGEGEGLSESLIGAGVGGAIGGTLGVAIPGIAKGIGVATAPIRSTIRQLRNPEGEAAKAIQAAIEKDRGLGAGMTDDAFNKLAQDGQPVILADRGGEATTGLVRTAADSSPEARQALANVLEPRYETQGNRLSEAFNKESALHGKVSEMVPGGAAQDMIEAAKAAAQAKNRPAYNAAYRAGADGIWDSTLEQLVNSPTVQTALKNAVAKAADRNVLEGFGAFNPKVSLDDAGNVVFRNAKGMPAYPDLRLWDLTKRELDGMASKAFASKDPDASLYAGFAKKLRDHLDSLPGVGPLYQKARATSAEGFGAQDSFTAGRNFALGAGGADKLQPRDAVKYWAKMSPKERALFAEGYIQAMRDKLAGVANRNNAARGVLQSETEKAKARIALGKDGAARLAAQLEVEKLMQVTKEAVSGNSKTARYLTEAALASAAGTGTALGGGDKYDISLAAGIAAGQKYGRRIATERMMKEVGRLLASRDPNAIQNLIRLATKHPQYLDAVRALSKSLAGIGGGQAGALVAQ